MGFFSLYSSTFLLLSSLFLPAVQERGQLDSLKQDLGTYAVPVSLKWRWKEDSQGTTLEKNWTEIVNTHSVWAPCIFHTVNKTVP